MGAIKPIRHRLMFPLFTILLILIIGFGIAIITQHHERLYENSLLLMNEASSDLSRLLDEQARALTALQSSLLKNAELRKIFKSRNRERLLAAYEPFFTVFAY